MNQYRDGDLNYIRTRKDHRCYGLGLGIIILDEVYPGFPGDVRNASAYPFPIQYEIVKGVDIKKLCYTDNKSQNFEPIKEAAQKLVRMGCRAIAAECGYFAYYQNQIAGHVDVPVFMSSLLQVPWAQNLIGLNKVVGILMSEPQDFPCLTEQHLKAVGIQPGTNYVIGGTMDPGVCAEFDHLWTEEHRTDPPSAYYDKAQEEFISVAVDFFQKHPNMGAIVLECTGFQPFARALQREIDIPVFSWGTLLDYAFSISVHRDYYGHI